MKKPPEGGFEKPDKSKNQPRPKNSASLIKVF
jgi:hypothetical protein